MNLLSAKTRKQICSGQVITDVKDVVKELIENSIDGGANVIEITTNELNQIVVKDNGVGVSEKDRSVLCKMYYTSKLKEFEDVEKVSTLGFRGEGLSSICASSTAVTIKTRCVNDNIGVLLNYDVNGELTSTNVAQVAVGTTVTVHNLFANHPVRRQLQLQQQQQEKQSKLILSLLHNYSLSSPHIHFSLHHEYHGHHLNFVKPKQNSVGDVIITTFGTKLYGFLKHYNLTIYDDDDGDGKDDGKDGKDDGKDDDRNVFCNIELYLPDIKGDRDVITRNTSDRIFTFINSRPVELPQITNVYFNRFRKAATPVGTMNRRYPFLYMNINNIPTNSYDINVTPSKNQVIVSSDIINLLATQLCKKVFDVIYPQQQQQQEKQEKQEELEEEEEFDSRKSFSKIQKLEPATTPSTSLQSQSVIYDYFNVSNNTPIITSANVNNKSNQTPATTTNEMQLVTHLKPELMKSTKLIGTIQNIPNLSIILVGENLIYAHIPQKGFVLLATI